MNKKYLPIPLIVALFFLIPACQDQSQQDVTSSNETAPSDTAKVERKKVVSPRFPSPAATVEQTIGLSSIRIEYSRPSVISQEGVDRTGKIWGRLVPYDFNTRRVMGEGKPRPWRAGANENTTITFSHDAKVEGQPIIAGKYGLHMAIHEAGGATVIFTNKSDAWGSFSYDQADDALRVEVDTEEIPLTERLIYTIQDIDKTSSQVVLDWEKKRIAFKVEFDTHGMVLADFRRYLLDTTGLTGSDYNRAAAYCATNSINLEEGLNWIEQSLSKEENYSNMSTKALILDAMGNSVEASTVQNTALELPSTEANDFYSYGTLLIRQGKSEQAMEIYRRLSEKWPDHWLSAHGMARGYSALGDYQKAIKYEQNALTKAPSVNKGFIEWAISKLEQGTDFN